MKLRPYRTLDWPAVCRIYDLAKPDELSGIVAPETICALDSDPAMKKLFEDSTITVAEIGSNVVGFARRRANFITWLFVDPGFRRAGVASALLSQLLSTAGRPTVLNVASTNLAARALYDRFGFKTEREFLGNFQGIPCSVARLSLA